MNDGYTSICWQEIINEMGQWMWDKQIQRQGQAQSMGHLLINRFFTEILKFTTKICRSVHGQIFWVGDTQSIIYIAFTRRKEQYYYPWPFLDT